MKRPTLGKFLKELRKNTFSGSNNEYANEYIEKVPEIIDMFHIPEVTQDQIMLQVFFMLLTGAASRWLRNKPASLIDTWETLKKKFLSKYYPPARTAKKMEEINNFQQERDETLCQAWERFKQIIDSKGDIPSMKAADAKKAIQDMADHSKKWHNGMSTRTRSTDTSDGLAAIQAQLNNLGRKTKKVDEKVYAALVGYESCGGPHYCLVELGASISNNICFCVVTDFEVVENMDVYRDEEMGDVIVGEPFCRASCVETRRFQGFITIHDDAAIVESECT
ncbi:hypothetical protein Tco_0410432 [Tanacetum coccineum]